MKKKIASWIFLVLSVSTFIYGTFYSIVVFIDIQKEMDRLAALPSASGVDYLGVYFGAWGLISILGICAVFGLLFSYITYKLAQNKTIKIVSVILLLLFGSIMLFSLFVAALGLYL